MGPIKGTSETMMKTLKLVLLSAFIAGQALAHSHVSHSIRPTEKRLIETAPGVKKWATAEEMDSLSEKAHEAGRCGGFMDITDFQDLDQGLALTSFLSFADMSPTQQTIVEPLLLKANEGDLVAKVTTLAAFNNRYYTADTGVAASDWIAAEYKKMAGSRTDIKVEQFKHSFEQSSVIATIEGAGPNKNEIVIIGGHIDSINQGAWIGKKKARAPGADDNASGTATVMETFRIFVDSGVRPNRTIQFIGYAAEEVGLLGSQDIAHNYKQNGKTVAAVLQFDMTMFPDGNPKIVFMEDFTNADLNRFMQKLVDTYVKAPWSVDKCGYGCSDHASWHKAGYPATMPFESTFKGMNHSIHSAADTLDILTPKHGVHYVKLGLSYIVEVANAK